MKKITLVTSERCAYCKKAKNLLKRIELLKPEYASVNIETINLLEATRRNLYCRTIPCFYLDDERVHEGYITIDELLNILDEAKKDKDSSPPEE